MHVYTQHSPWQKRQQLARTMIANEIEFSGRLSKEALKALSFRVLKEQSEGKRFPALQFILVVLLYSVIQSIKHRSKEDKEIGKGIENGKKSATYTPCGRQREQKDSTHKRQGRTSSTERNRVRLTRPQGETQKLIDNRQSAINYPFGLALTR